MKVKICGLTERQNLLDVLSLHPDYIGLNFYAGSKRFAGDDKELPPLMHPITGIYKTGVFVNERTEAIRQTINTYSLDYVQLHGDELPAACAAIDVSKPVIKAFQMILDFDFGQLKEYVGSCTYFLFDNPSSNYGGSGQQFDWKIFYDKEIPLPFFLSGGIGPEHMTQLKEFKHEQFMGIDVNSKFEQSPGVKNINDLKTFIDDIRN